MNLVYKEPEGCPKLKAGGLVAVCERDGSLSSILSVKRSGHKFMTLEDGRRFRNGTGWFIGSQQDWPFPYIRMLTKIEREAACKRKRSLVTGDAMKVSVTMDAKDWIDLVNFVVGDINCMDHDDGGIKSQMKRMVKTINETIARAQFNALQVTP